MIEIPIKDMSGEVLYTHEQENNTIKITVEKAVREGHKIINAYFGLSYMVYFCCFWLCSYNACSSRIFFPLPIKENKDTGGVITSCY